VNRKSGTKRVGVRQNGSNCPSVRWQESCISGESLSKKS
jgi:hypothetical protein